MYTIVINDGYCIVNDLNFKIQQFHMSDNLSVTSSSGSNIIHGVDLAMNYSVRCLVQLNLYSLPTEVQSRIFNTRCYLEFSTDGCCRF